MKLAEIAVVGGSAEALSSLLRIVKDVPEKLLASFFGFLHVSSDGHFLICDGATRTTPITFSGRATCFPNPGRFALLTSERSKST